jgi:radical SAM enzyme (TIGR01210 family)
MSTAMMKQLLRACGARISVLRGADEDYQIPTGVDARLETALASPSKQPWASTGASERLLSGRHPMDNASDVLLWLEASIRQRLRVRFGVLVFGTEERALERLMRAALVECLLVVQLRQATIIPTIGALFERDHAEFEHFDHDLAQLLSGLVTSGDVRSIILSLAPKLLHIDGRLLMQELRMCFPSRTPWVSAEWIAEYQQEERPAQYWFYNSLLGPSIFLTLFTERCRYGRCHGCTLHSLGADRHIKPFDINKQIDFFFERVLTDVEQRQTRELILSNNGSLLDRKTFPMSSLLFACVSAVGSLPNLSRIVLETRAQFVRKADIQLIRETLDAQRPGIDVQIAVGVELFDPALRNRGYRKGLTGKALEHLMENLAATGVGLRAYFMYKPLPGMSHSQADEDIRRALDWFSKQASKHDLDITLHINPTYVPADTDLHDAFLAGEFEPPRIEDLENLIASLPDSPVGIYVGLSDEGLAVPGGSFRRPESRESLDRLAGFNRKGDKSVLLRRQA